MSHPPVSDIPVGFLRQPAQTRKPQSQDTAYNLLIPQIVPHYRLKLAEQGVSGWMNTNSKVGFNPPPPLHYKNGPCREGQGP